MLILSFNAFTLSGSALGKTNTVNVLSYTFAQDQEEAVIRTVDRQVSAFVRQEGNVLTIEGTDELEFNELDGQFLTVDFRLVDTQTGNEKQSQTIKGYQAEFTLSGDPVYWRLDTGGKVYGIGNTELSQPEKLRELLPTILQGIKADFYTIRQWNNSLQVQMSLKNDTARDTDFYSSQINRSSLPEELRKLVESDNGISTLELKANYEMDIPLVLKGEKRNKDTSCIKLRLTLITRINLCTD
ncbi:hypothetical protein R2R35_10700 [Anaerocolumna sp. AGMB13020]|uniref:hypothetical protein n=1 Tax=Anaerocolumna sp. AGMB13020 TaxID=3081750 RepID=UPI002954EB52|nr:hypothetical protein [Anaerocolumna sp. AGMB13020]WOO38924.1 hypothetical protein R2R35_10700 [Anaerocolumna sp. AGMB13020]